MKIKIAVLVVLCMMFAAVAQLAAQDDAKTAAKTRTITGCLSKGDDKGEYHITDSAGSRWDVKSDNVNLSEHVGHSVKATGVVSNATAHGVKEAVKTGVDSKSKETGDMRVTERTMVSESCK